MEHDPYRNESETLSEHHGLTGDDPADAERIGAQAAPANETLRNIVHFLKAPS